ncbi:signal transduction histidine kinase [Anaerotaenia torta]|uniref:sensor histidine kinase n=1 Tax=Anaerotaenia torta TaxID=433293 RepID=UPI003D25F142
MFKKLRNRFLFLNMAITCLVMFAAFSAVYLTTYRNIQNENQKKLGGMSKTIMVSSENAIDQPETASDGLLSERQEQGHMVREVSSDYMPSFTIFLDQNGRITDIDTILDLPEEIYREAARIAWQKGAKSPISLEGRLWMYSVSPVSITQIYEDGRSVTNTSDNNYQISFLDITDTQKTLRDLLITFVFVGIAMLAAIFLISLYFANRSVGPIASAWEKQRQFVADASHELKTPLSIITANYDALLANQDETIRSQHEWLDYMKIGTDRMAKLINSLLLLAKMEDADIEAPKAPFDISDIIHREIASMEAAAAEKGLSILKRIGTDIVINSDQEMVSQVFTILLENAIKYSDINGTITVSLTKSGHSVICSVKNSGKGIAKEDLPRIFDRFYRADKSRSEDSVSYGLGLSIAKAMINRLEGDIAVESIENEWTVFRFTLYNSM